MGVARFKGETTFSKGGSGGCKALIIAFAADEVLICQCDSYVTILKCHNNMCVNGKFSHFAVLLISSLPSRDH